MQREVFNSLPMGARNKNGTSVLLSYSTAPIVDPDGCVVGTMAVVYDITEKMRLETALRESLGKWPGQGIASALQVIGAGRGRDFEPGRG